MREAAIIGAGELGGALAGRLARRDVVRTVTLIDDGGRIAEGKALDIAQAAPVESFATGLVGTTDIARAAGASIVVIADRSGDRGEWHGDEGLMLLRRLTEFAPRAVIVCAGARQRELVDAGVRELKIARRRLFGTAPEALTAAARALIALAVEGSPQDVGVSVLGVPPSHTVIAWEDGTVAGSRLTALIDDPSRRRLLTRIAALWPPGPHALAAAAAKAIEAMAGRSRPVVSCFVAPEAPDRVSTRTAALPARLDTLGISQVVAPVLSVAERVALETAMIL